MPKVQISMGELASLFVEGLVRWRETGRFGICLQLDPIGDVGSPWDRACERLATFDDPLPPSACSLLGMKLGSTYSDAALIVIDLWKHSPAMTAEEYEAEYEASEAALAKARETVERFFGRSLGEDA